MKVIDLLNKIANGEDVPRVKYNDIEAYIGADGYLKDDYGDNVEWWIDKNWLNTEVEKIEEDKKIPTLKNLNLTKIDINKEGQVYGATKKEMIADIQTLQKWINKIIDKMNKE